MNFHICAGLDGVPTILCFDALGLSVFSEYRKFIERKSGGVIRLIRWVSKSGGGVVS